MVTPICLPLSKVPPPLSLLCQSVSLQVSSCDERIREAELSAGTDFSRGYRGIHLRDQVYVTRMYNTTSNRNRSRVSLCPISRWYLSLFFLLSQGRKHPSPAAWFSLRADPFFSVAQTHTLLGYWRDTVRASCLIRCCP